MECLRSIRPNPRDPAPIDSQHPRPLVSASATILLLPRRIVATSVASERRFAWCTMALALVAFWVAFTNSAAFAA